MTPSRRLLKVLMTADAVGGVWVFASTLARELCRRGHEVTLVTLGPRPSPDQLGELSDVHGLTIEPTDLALEWIDPAGQDRRRAERRLAAIGRRISPDVVHLNSYREAAFAWDAPVLVTAHSCVRSWSLVCRGQEMGEAEWTVYGDQVRKGLSTAQHWTAPSKWYAGLVQRLYAPSAPGQVIYNGVADAMPAGDRRPVIMAAGRFWDEAKNLKIIADAQSEVSWPIRVAGPVQPPESIDPRLTLLGAVARPSLLRELARAEIFVSPALYEPFGLTVLEAAACGCALVLSDIPSFRELWDGAALFIGPRDSEALAHELNRLAQDKRARMHLQNAARRRARTYSLEKMADGYSEAYAMITKTTKKPRDLPVAVEVAS